MSHRPPVKAGFGNDHEPPLSPLDASDFEDDGEADLDDDFEVQDQVQLLEEIIKICKNHPADDPASLLSQHHLSTLSHSLSLPFNSSTNVLHLVVDTKQKASDVKLLVIYVMSNFSYLMREKNDQQHTPLHSAVVGGSLGLVKLFCNVIKSDADQILNSVDDLNNNCLHTAFLRNGRRNAQGIVSALLKKVSQNSIVLRHVNHKHQTPLHLAVEYERCTTSQVKIVQTMVHRSPATLDCHLWEDPHSCLSIYRHHLFTQEQYTEREKSRRATKHTDAASTRQQAESWKLNKTEVTPHFQHGNKPGDHAKSRKAVPDTSTRQSAPVLNRQASRFAVTHLKTQRIGVESAEMQASSPTTPSGDHGASSNVKMKRQLPAPRVTKEVEHVSEEAATQIRQFLKLYYMRNRTDHDHILSFLYPPTKDKAIYWSWRDCPKQIDLNTLESMSEFLHFEDTLQYVEIPCTKVIATKPFTQRGAVKGEVEDDLVEHTGYNVIFGWLRDEGVKSILKLHVDDRNQPHSDEAMERALKGITVHQTWNWMRLDLAANVILAAAPEVEEVLLYWSGNNAVLQSWSAPFGLIALKNLKRITVHAAEGLESSARSQLYRDSFIKEIQANLQLEHNSNLRQINENRAQDVLSSGIGDDQGVGEDEPQITASLAANASETTGITLPQGGTKPNIHLSAVEPAKPQMPIRKIDVSFKPMPHSSQAPGSHGGHKTPGQAMMDPQQWLKCMYDFAEFVQNVDLEEFCPGLPADAAIKVALIDDGLDTQHEMIKGKVYGGRSYRTEDNVNLPYWGTSGFHGTQMASLICQVCPAARLYAIRLNEVSTGPTGARQIDADSAVKAVQAAIDMGVDIISMSWVLQSNPNNEAAIARLEAILDTAQAGEKGSKKMLLFCSANDQGTKADDKSHPLSNHTRRFKIGAATEYGSPSQWVNAEHVDYLFPGERVMDQRALGKRTDHVPQDQRTPLSGSSVATALAAGLAAQILHCANISAYRAQYMDETRPRMSHSNLAKLRDRQVMGEVFQNIGTSQESRKYLQVWKAFEVPDPGEQATPDERWEACMTRVEEALFRNLFR